ncbi:MAG TPA: rod shape-determining protein MreC [Actinomycetota bacterium]|nr:rod shape-determining protein MreC [Actinomycetota bacterium]
MAIRPRPRSTRLLVVTLVSVSLAIITLDYRGGTTGPLAGLGRVAKAAIAPMQEAVTSVTRPVGNFFSGVANLPSLAEENRQLKEELAETRAIAVGAQRDASENEELRDLLGLQDIRGGVPALVIGNGVSNFDWTITIDKGASDGIANDMPVVAGSPEAARLVGKVIDVTADSAEVQLILDPDHAAAAEIAGTPAVGVIKGRGDQDLVMEDVDPDLSEMLGGDDNVFTLGYVVDGQPGVYPSGLLIGQISRVAPEPNSLQLPIEIRPAVDFTTLNAVLVLQPTTRRDVAGSTTP